MPLRARCSPSAECHLHVTIDDVDAFSILSRRAAELDDVAAGRQRPERNGPAALDDAIRTGIEEGWYRCGYNSGRSSGIRSTTLVFPKVSFLRDR